jgi:hypothetical protein
MITYNSMRLLLGNFASKFNLFCQEKKGPGSPNLKLFEMEFLDINLTKDSSLLLHAIHSLSIGGKPDSTHTKKIKILGRGTSVALGIFPSIGFQTIISFRYSTLRIFLPSSQVTDTDRHENDIVVVRGD